MYTYDNGIVKLENKTRKLFYEFQYKVTDYVYTNVDNQTILSYNDFRLQCLALLDHKTLDNIFDSLVKESKKQIDVTAKTFDLEIANELYLYTNEKVYDELYELFKNKINEMIDYYYNVYLNIKKQTDVALNDNVLNLLTEYSYRYGEFNFKRLLNKLEQDNKSVYDILVNVNVVLAQTKLNSLKYQYDSLNKYQKQVKSESGKRKYNLSDYLVIALVYNMRSLFWENIKTIYKDNGVQLVKWDNTMPNKMCPTCREYYGKIYLLNELEKTPPMHERCRCVLIPQDAKDYSQLFEDKKIPNKNLRTNFEKNLKDLTK
jgi:SPP1 gp7 family putative phage head morphogenesis protein